MFMNQNIFSQIFTQIFSFMFKTNVIFVCLAFNFQIVFGNKMNLKFKPMLKKNWLKHAKETTRKVALQS